MATSDVFSLHTKGGFDLQDLVVAPAFSLAAVVLTEDGHENRAYDLTGPEALTYEEVAAAFSDVLDRPITYADPSILTFVRRMRSRGEPLPFVALMVGIYTTARLGLADRVTDDVERLLGRPARDVATFVADYAEEFRPAGAAGRDRITASERSGR